MEVKKDSIFSPQSKRNLVVTASLAMALGMGIAPGIAFADEYDGDPTITRADAVQVADTPIVACVESAPAAPTIRRNGADALVAESTGTVTEWVVTDTGTGVPSNSSHSNGSSTTTYNNPGSYTHTETVTFTDPGTYTFTDPGTYVTDTSHSTTTNQSGYVPVTVIGDPNGGETTVNVVPTTGSVSVNVSLGRTGGNQQTEQTTQNHANQQLTQTTTQTTQPTQTTQQLSHVTQQPAQTTQQTVSVTEAKDDKVAEELSVATERLSDFVAEAALASDFEDQLDAESVTIIGEPELKSIAEGVFEILKMPGLEVKKDGGAAATNETYWWCVYIDGVKTKIMDTVGNLAEGIDHYLWSPEGKVDPTTFEGDLVYAQDPGMTVVMTASSMLGVEAVSTPEREDTSVSGSIVEAQPVSEAKDVASDTNDGKTDVVEPTTSLSGRIASYIPTQVATAPAVEAAAEVAETLAVTADHTDATPIVAWGAAGVATLLVAAMRRRHEADNR